MSTPTSSKKHYFKLFLSNFILYIILFMNLSYKKDKNRKLVYEYSNFFEKTLF